MAQSPTCVVMRGYCLNANAAIDGDIYTMCSVSYILFILISLDMCICLIYGNKFTGFVWVL